MIKHIKGAPPKVGRVRCRINGKFVSWKQAAEHSLRIMEEIEKEQSGIVNRETVVSKLNQASKTLQARKQCGNK